MKLMVNGPGSMARSFVRLFCLLLLALCLHGCSLPNLEDPDCTKARDVVREFYSFHFGNDMQPTAENIALREKFLTPAFVGRLKSLPATTTDPFTHTEEFPKAFRVGECKVVEPGQAVRFGVLLFWKDDVKSQQRPVFTSVRKENGNWLIDDVSPLDK
jgi:hypothetical protein